MKPLSPVCTYPRTIPSKILIFAVCKPTNTPFGFALQKSTEHLNKCHSQKVVASGAQAVKDDLKLYCKTKDEIGFVSSSNLVFMIVYCVLKAFVCLLLSFCRYLSFFLCFRLLTFFLSLQQRDS
jgi:hypothetical protein